MCTLLLLKKNPVRNRIGDPIILKNPNRVLKVSTSIIKKKRRLYLETP